MIGATETWSPLLTEIFPGEITPVPFANTGTKSVLPPRVIVAARESNEVIDGAATAVT